MRFLLAALALAAAFPAAAQTPAGRPDGALNEAELAQKAVDTLKAYTDTFRVPSDAAFPVPPPIALFKAKDVQANAFSDNNIAFNDYKKTISKYRERFFWDENSPAQPGEPQLDAERFQVAYGRASSRGADPAAGARWACGLATALRGYFLFYNELNGGEKGGWLSRYTWGIGTAPVDQEQAINGEIAKRFKEATDVDLGESLNYSTLERCAASASAAVEKAHPKPKPIASLMKAPPPAGVETFMKEDVSDVDFAKYDYWVFYYDASWQPWSSVARTSKWKDTPEDFKRFVLCRAPLWVGNYVSRAPKNAGAPPSYFPPKGSTTLRHPLQPDKASLRNRQMIEQYRKMYCR